MSPSPTPRVPGLGLRRPGVRVRPGVEGGRWTSEEERGLRGVVPSRLGLATHDKRGLRGRGYADLGFLRVRRGLPAKVCVRVQEVFH